MNQSILSSERFKEILETGENVTVEFKTCQNELSNSVFETVCSFSNRFGGYIFLGVKEENGKGGVVGVNPKNIQNLKKNFINVLGNPNKINPSLFLNLEELEIDGKIVLWC